MQKHNFRRLGERLTYPLVLPDLVPEGLTALLIHCSRGPNKAQLRSRSQSGLAGAGTGDEAATDRWRYRGASGGV